MGVDSLCVMNVVGAGLPYRTGLLLARERTSFPSMAAGLFAEDKGETRTNTLTSEVLLRALDLKESWNAYAAAFLIGRCRARDGAADRALTLRLIEVLDKETPPDVAIEAAMSLVLRGEVRRGQKALRKLLESPQPLGDQYKAAFYLAQIGDPSGYGALVQTLRGEIPHYRLMALRHAAAFLPYVGRKITDTTVDVRGLLSERLADPDELVRSEVPFYLEEIRATNLRALLTPIAEKDPSMAVRTAARIVLERTVLRKTS